MKYLQKTEIRKKFGRIVLITSVAFIFLLATLTIVNATSQVSCLVLSAPCPSDMTTALLIRNDTGGWENAHTQLPSVNTYPYALCCRGQGNDLGNSCSESINFIIARLSDTSNAHIQQSNYTNYAQAACLSSKYPNNITCLYQDNSCPESYNCTFSMASSDSIGNATNAHFGTCDHYVRKICCKIITAVSDNREEVFQVLTPISSQNQKIIVSFRQKIVNFFINMYIKILNFLGIK